MTTSVKTISCHPNLISNLNQALLRRKDVEQDESSKPTSSSSKSENVNLDVEDEDCTKLRILVTNGDGIESPRLTYLVEALVKEGLYNVFVCAPQMLNLKHICDGRDKSTSGGVTFGETIAVSSVEMKVSEKLWREKVMEKTSKELLQLEHKDPSSSFKESALLVCGKSKKSTEEKPFPVPLPKSQVLGKVKDFLGVISEANKTLQLNAKDKPEEFDIEVLHGNESEYIEMDLMLGVADLQTPEAMEAAEAAMAGNQPVVDLRTNDSSSESESSSDDEDDDDDEDDSDEDENVKADSVQVEPEGRTKRKQPKIVVLP